MPVKLVTPSRAGLIISTAAVVSLMQLAFISPPPSSSSSLDVGRQTYLEKALRGPIAQDDPLLLEWILDKTAPPSREPYNLNYFFSGLSDEFNSSNPYSPSQEFILEHIENFFGAQINMPFVFVEAGAYDGEFLSNTLMLEKEHGWRGLLIEPNRKSFEKLLAKHRKAWAINACLSTNPFPSQESFTTVEASGKIDFIANAIPGAKPGPNGMNDTGKASSRLSRFYNYSDDTLRPAGRETVQCLPLYSITRALNMNHINLFSLDVEGAEMDILKTIPWGALTFTMLVIEHIPGDTLLVEFMESKGYALIAHQYPDYIFVVKTAVKFQLPISPGNRRKKFWKTSKKLL